MDGGDVFFRSRVGPGPVCMVLERLQPVLDRGVPVIVVPVNHERSVMALIDLEVRIERTDPEDIEQAFRKAFSSIDPGGSSG